MKKKFLLLTLFALLVSCGKTPNNSSGGSIPSSEDIDEDMEDIPEIVIEDDPFEPS